MPKPPPKPPIDTPDMCWPAFVCLCAFAGGFVAGLGMVALEDCSSPPRARVTERAPARVNALPPAGGSAV